MNLKHFTTFLALCQEKSFTKTAAALGMAQSGVTTHIKLLEQELGVRLFERIGKSVALTAEGEWLIPHARKMLALSEEISRLYQHSGRLTIGVTESIANYLFGDILKEYTALYPDTEIFLKILGSQDYCQMLTCGEIDLAIALGPPVKSKSIQVLHKRKENIILIASSTHELSGKGHITPRELSAYPLLLPPPDCPYRILFEQQMHAEGIRPKIALETDSVSVIKESSLCGIGLGLLPEFTVRKELIYHMAEKLHYAWPKKAAGGALSMYTQILIHPDKWLSPDLERFLEVAGKHFI